LQTWTLESLLEKLTFEYSQQHLFLFGHER